MAEDYRQGIIQRVQGGDDQFPSLLSSFDLNNPNLPHPPFGSFGSHLKLGLDLLSARAEKPERTLVRKKTLVLGVWGFSLSEVVFISF